MGESHEKVPNQYPATMSGKGVSEKLRQIQ